MKTAQPGGAGDLVVKVEGGFGVEIPWDRERRRRATFAACGAGPDNRTDGMRSRYERLAGSPWWPELLGHLAAYVSETIPAPDVLGCSLWTATAMTRRACRGGGSSTVLCCISVGNVETLVLFDGAGGPAGFLNMRLPARLPAACRRGDAWLRGGVVSFRLSGRLCGICLFGRACCPPFRSVGPRRLLPPQRRDASEGFVYVRAELECVPYRRNPG